MRKYRNAFTLIEMMISISILSIIMIFLYQSYAAINQSNRLYAKKTNSIIGEQKRQRVIYMDFSLALFGTISIIKQEKNEDTVFMQSSNSIHQRYNPYIAYILKDEKLYRLESLKKLKYPLGIDDQYEVDYFGEVDSFRVYESIKKSDTNSSASHLISISFKKEDDILLKVTPLNGY